MFRRALLLALLVSSAAYAGDTYRHGLHVVTVGDTASKLTELVGEPGYKEPIESKAGGFEGERWQYSIDHKTVTFEIRSGRIASIDERKD